MLKLKNITLSFGNHTVLDDFNYNFQNGTIYGLVAPNGTGKSTLINVILNNLKPQKGYVEYNELQYKNEKTIVKLHQEICAFPDQSELFSFMTGRDHLKLYANLWHNNPQKVKDIIEENGTVTKVEKMGMKKLAYEIQKMSEGFFYFIQFEASASAPAQIEHKVRIMDNVLRFLCVRKDEA